MDTAEIVLTIVLTIVGLLGGTAGLKWKQTKNLLAQASQAVVALGLCGIKATQALDDDRITSEERKDIASGIKAVGGEFHQTVEAAGALFSRNSL